VSFLDEDELAPARGGPGSRRPGADRQRQVMLRRVIALGVAILILILILLGIRGCLNAREERGYDNYVSDLSSVVTESNQLSSDFFGRLQEPPNDLDELAIEAEIATDRGTAESQLQRVEGLDTPDELAGAQAELEQAFTLRRDGLEGIAADIPTALGSEGRKEAIDRIVGDMEQFLASDVLYRRAQTEIQEVLTSENIDGQVPDSAFLPQPHAQWLDSLELGVILTTFATDTGAATRGVHGLEVLSAGIGRTTLTAGTENTIELGNDAPEVVVEVQNGGESQENDVVVSYTLSGGGASIEGEGTIPRLDAQGIEEVTIPLDGEPDTGVPLTLEVEVLPVIGETLFDNNSLTYTVTFG
jgi:hypothetical protein